MVELIVYPIANLRLIVCVGVLTATIPHAFFPFAIIGATIAPSKFACTMLQICLVFSFVDKCAFLRKPDHFAVAIELALYKIAFECSTIIPNLLACAVVLVSLPLTLVTPCRIFSSALTMPKTISQLPRVLGAIAEIHIDGLISIATIFRGFWKFPTGWSRVPTSRLVGTIHNIRWVVARTVWHQISLQTNARRCGGRYTHDFAAQRRPFDGLSGIISNSSAALA
mmetsp:Transcript_83560/g.132066  ORF Transcript_83560/g.132066 Transcript_83560/m.132066 type:complete len:225 (-) Transcript_83560:156-830(-)